MRKIIKWVIIALLIIIFLPLILSYSNYRMTRVTNDHEAMFTEQLKTAVQKGKPFDMKDVATFDWDKMFMFQTYGSREEMEKAVGVAWNSETSYVGYLIDRKMIGDFPMLDESIHKLVFVNDDEVVLDITLDRAIADFTASSRMIDRKHSQYIIKKTEGAYAVLKNVLEE
ncbi:hypothetical protein [Bacillus sp. FJAT-28004]|uniref:hypothetical protein n=1 Tax=Bacillus sp. FJAT-28004 TaxID=1679165 RepID=UPI0006B557C8|nr:hypothetical protein [Bacillus sp. FJAT-28004]